MSWQRQGYCLDSLHAGIDAQTKIVCEKVSRPQYDLGDLTLRSHLGRLHYGSCRSLIRGFYTIPMEDRVLFFIYIHSCTSSRRLHWAWLLSYLIKYI
jgi:hypothetical protein